MLRFALCDDDEKQRTAVGRLLLDYAAARPGLSVKVSTFSSGLELLAAEEVDGFDLYVLDVVMPGLSGIQLGEHLREMGSSGIIIYLTISPEYAIDSYSVRAFQYLVKPVKPEKLFRVLDDAVAILEKERNACITVKSREGLRRVRLDEILYAELADRTVHYHLTSGERLDSTTIRGPFQEEIAPLLADPGFFLCGASFAVNLFYVTAVEKGCLLLDGGRRVPLSRSLAAQARQRWSSYWLDSSKQSSYPERPYSIQGEKPL